MASNHRRANLAHFLVIAVLLLACTGLEFYFHFLLGIHIVYTHLFYIPIVLAALWWGLKGGFPVSLFLAFLHIAPYLPGVELAVLSRAFMFILVGSMIGIVSDRRKRAEEELRTSEQEYRTLFEYSGRAVVLIAPDITLLMVNRKFEELSGCSKEEAEGKMSWTQFVAEKDKKRMLSYHKQRRVNQTKVPTHYEFTFVRKDGEERMIDLEVSVIPNTNLSIASLQDITERKKIEKERKKLTKELKRLARIDGLTGIYNRQYLDKKIKDEVQRAKRYNRPLSIIMLDADNFKEINDRCGHKVGDRTLKAIARKMQRMIRTTDFVGRYGGEEFLAVCVETAMDEAMNIAERIRGAIGEMQVKDKEGSPIGVTVSLGVAQYNESEDTDHLVTRADNALYRAKTEGRNRVYRAEEG